MAPHNKTARNTTWLRILESAFAIFAKIRISCCYHRRDMRACRR